MALFVLKVPVLSCVVSTALKHPDFDNSSCALTKSQPGSLYRILTRLHSLTIVTEASSKAQHWLAQLWVSVAASGSAEAFSRLVIRAAEATGAGEVVLVDYHRGFQAFEFEYKAEVLRAVAGGTWEVGYDSLGLPGMKDMNRIELRRIGRKGNAF